MKYIKAFETHVNDKLNEEFKKFVKKYRKYKSDGDYYVQFSNYKDNTMDRTFISSDDSDHSDLEGTYGYPLKYVIDYPMDIWYGINFKYLRVLKAVSFEKTLFLNDIKDKEDCIYFLKNVFNTNSMEIEEEILNPMKKEHPNKITGSTKYTKMAFQGIQYDYTEDRIRSGKEQSEILLKAGYDSVIDNSRNVNTAIINDREPNQIIFLNRASFRVEEVFNMTNKDKFNSESVTQSDDITLSRKYASRILSTIGDKIKETGKKDTYGSVFYSVKGREITVQFRNNKNTDGLKIGQKRHKENKKNNNVSVYIWLKTEKGEIFHSLPTDGEFKDLISAFDKSWSNIKDNKDLDNWQSRNIKNRDIAIDKERKERFAKQKEEKYQKKKSSLHKWKRKIDFWNKRLNGKFDINQEENILFAYMDFEEMIERKFQMVNKKERILEIVDSLKNNFNDETEEDPNWFITDLIGDESDNNVYNANSFLNLMSSIVLEAIDNGDMFYPYLNFTYVSDF